MVVANLLGAFEGPELLIILALILLLFGGKKLPELARSLGQAKKEFQEGAAPVDEPAAVASPQPEDTVTVSAAELERLRKAAGETTP